MPLLTKNFIKNLKETRNFRHFSSSKTFPFVKNGKIVTVVSKEKKVRGEEEFVMEERRNLHSETLYIVTYTTIVSFVCSIAPMYVSGRTCVYDHGVGGSRSGGRDVAVEGKERKGKKKKKTNKRARKHEKSKNKKEKD